MNDQIIQLEDSLIQHGKENDRIYLMKLGKQNIPQTIEKMDDLAKEKRYSKIFAKVREDAVIYFKEHKYKEEAFIPEFYNGVQDCSFMGKYFQENRRTVQDEELLKDVISAAQNKGGKRSADTLPSSFTIMKMGKKDIQEMVSIYKEVFKTYPFPIHEEEYLAQTMEENYIYYGIRKEGRLVALSTIELYEKDSNAEMTDFATLPDFRGNGLAIYLLEAMEEELIRRKIKMAYTIARAKSYGMNITFSKNKYMYTGTLINNTNISGNIESMNVWYKKMK